MSSLSVRILDIWHYLLHHSLRYLPMPFVSAFGGLMVRLSVRINRPEIIANALANVKTHKPGVSESEARKIVDSYLDNVGRIMAEFSIIHKSGPNISFVNWEPMISAYGRKPILAIILHTGNWEMFGPAFTKQGLKATSFYEYPDSVTHQRIIENVRKAAGIDLLPPTLRGVRQAMELLKQNKFVAIFGDEARDGNAMAPLFGRPPHMQGNLAIAAKMARRTGATLVIGHCERKKSCTFRLHFSDLFELPAEVDDPLEDVRFLNSRIEPIILSHLSSWYYLDDRLDEIRQPR